VIRMKLAVSQIRKSKGVFSFEVDFDLAKEIKRIDLLGVNRCYIVGHITEPQRDYFLVKLHFDIELVMACAVSLEEVIYPLEFSQEVIYSYEEDEDSDNYLIERDTLDLDQAFITEIVLNLPYRVVKEGYEDQFEEDLL